MPSWNVCTSVRPWGYAKRCFKGAFNKAEKVPLLLGFPDKIKFAS